jgi:HAD superfamily hydrolase (TIGR01549 family)
MLRVVFLDVGDLLVDTTTLMQASLESASLRVGQIWKRIDSEFLVRLYEETDRATTRPHINHLFGDWEVADIAFAELTHGQRDPRLIATFLTYYRDRLRRLIHADAEVEALLQWMRARSGRFMFGVVSDGTEEEQLEVLVRIGLIDLLEPNLLLVSEAVGSEKNTANIYRLAIERAGCAPHEIVMLGDNPTRDYDVPRGLGLRAVLVARFPGGRYRAEALRRVDVCHSLSQALSQVEKFDREL